MKIFTVKWFNAGKYHQRRFSTIEEAIELKETYNRCLPHVAVRIESEG